MGIDLCQTKEAVSVLLSGYKDRCGRALEHTLQLHFDHILEEDQGDTGLCTSLASTRDTKIASH